MELTNISPSSLLDFARSYDGQAKIMTSKKKKTLISFKKAQSLMGKIIEMIEEDKYCIDIMQQNLAAIGLLKSANQQLMENHLHTCFSRVVKNCNAKSRQKHQEMIKEILKVEKLSNK